MNGYEKHSPDYGGPEPGRGFVAVAVLLFILGAGLMFLAEFLS